MIEIKKSIDEPLEILQKQFSLSRAEQHGDNIDVYFFKLVDISFFFFF